MNVLIVHAHNEKQSFCTALKNKAVEVLSAQGHDVQVSDLYAMNWNPIASADDFTERKNEDYLVYALEQREGVKSGTIAPDIQQELDKLVWADILILNFPIYWFSMPAIMKGWIDRVFVSGICYGGKRFYNHGGLKGKKALINCTIGGRDHMFGDEAIHGPIEDMLRPILRGTLYYVGLDVLAPNINWHVPYVDDATRQGYLVAYEKLLCNLEAAEVLTFPRLEEFDERLYPLKPSK